MQIDRAAGFAPRSRRLAEEFAPLYEPCIGCKNCAGICIALIDVTQLPELVLKGAPA